jgi:hypothetical protein
MITRSSSAREVGIAAQELRPQELHHRHYAARRLLEQLRIFVEQCAGAWRGELLRQKQLYLRRVAQKALRHSRESAGHGVACFDRANDDREVDVLVVGQRPDVERHVVALAEVGGRRGDREVEQRRDPGAPLILRFGVETVARSHAVAGVAVEALAKERTRELRLRPQVVVREIRAEQLGAVLTVYACVLVDRPHRACWIVRRGVERRGAFTPVGRLRELHAVSLARTEQLACVIREALDFAPELPEARVEGQREIDGQHAGTSMPIADRCRPVTPWSRRCE